MILSIRLCIAFLFFTTYGHSFRTLRWDNRCYQAPQGNSSIFFGETPTPEEWKLVDEYVQSSEYMSHLLYGYRQPEQCDMEDSAGCVGSLARNALYNSMLNGHSTFTNTSLSIYSQLNQLDHGTISSFEEVRQVYDAVESQTNTTANSTTSENYSFFRTAFDREAPSLKTVTYESFMAYYSMALADYLYSIFNNKISSLLLKLHLVVPLFFVVGLFLYFKSPPQKAPNGDINGGVISNSVDALFAERMLSKRMSNFAGYYLQRILQPMYDSDQTSPLASYILENLELLFTVPLKRVLNFFIKIENFRTILNFALVHLDHYSQDRLDDIKVLARRSDQQPAEPSSGDSTVMRSIVGIVPPKRTSKSGKSLCTFKDYFFDVFYEYKQEFPSAVVLTIFATLIGLFLQQLLVQIGLFYHPPETRPYLYAELTKEDVASNVPMVFFAVFSKRVLGNFFLILRSILSKDLYFFLAAFSVTGVFVVLRWITEIFKRYVPIIEKEQQKPTNSEGENSKVKKHHLVLTENGKKICYFIIAYLAAYAIYSMFSSFTISKWSIGIGIWALVLIFSYRLIVAPYKLRGRDVASSFLLTMWRFSIGDFYGISNTLLKAWYLLMEWAYNGDYLIYDIAKTSIYLLLHTASTIKSYMIENGRVVTDCSAFGKPCPFRPETIKDSKKASKNPTKYNDTASIEMQKASLLFFEDFVPDESILKCDAYLAFSQTRDHCCLWGEERKNFQNYLKEYEMLTAHYFGYIFRNQDDQRQFDIQVADLFFRLIRENKVASYIFSNHLPLPILFFLFGLYTEIRTRLNTMVYQEDICGVNVLAIVFDNIYSYLWSGIIVIIFYFLQHLVLQMVLYYSIRYYSSETNSYTSFPSVDLASKLFSAMIPMKQLLINSVASVVTRRFFKIDPEIHSNIKQNHRYLFIISNLWARFSEASTAITKVIIYRLLCYGISLLFQSDLHYLITWATSLLSLIAFCLWASIDDSFFHRLGWYLSYGMMYLILAVTLCLPVVIFSTDSVVFSSAVYFIHYIWGFFSIDIKYAATYALVFNSDCFIPKFILDLKIKPPFRGILDGLILLMIRLFDLATQGPIYQQYIS